MNKGPVVRWMWLFFLLISPLWWTPAFSAEGPQTFTLDGRIKQAGTATPILDPSVKIEVHVMDPSRQCVIYAEEQFVNTQTTNGYFNIQVGSNTGAGKRIAGVDPGLAMGTVFSNAAAMVATNVSGQTCPQVLGVPTYTPTTKDARYFRIFVTPSGTAITDTLADVVLDAVPNAMVAESALSAQSVGGVTAANLLQVNTAGGHVLTQANLDVVFTTSNYSALTALLAGTSTLYNKPAANGTTVIPAIAAPSSPSAGQVWYNAGDILYHDGTTTRTISTGSSTSVSASNGTAASPSISFSGDTDTGWYLAGADNLAAATGGVERVRINENGNLGIGSAAPDARLTLGGNMTAPAWTSSGIGIRQNSATYTDSSSSGTVGFNYVNAFGVPTLAASSATTYTNASAFSLYPPVPGANTTITNSTGLTVNASNLTGVTSGYGLQVNAPTGATNNYAASFMGGNVGIGTTAPSAQLHVTNATGGNVYLRPGNSATIQGTNTAVNGIANLQLQAVGDGANFVGVRLLSDEATDKTWQMVHKASGGTLNDLTFEGHDGTTWRSPLTLKMDGTVRTGSSSKVAIGVTTPTALMHLKAGSATAGTAPLKFTSGPVNTAPEAGAIEYDGTSLFYTDDTNTRRTLGIAGSGITALTGEVTASGTGSVAATIADNAITNAKIADNAVNTAEIADDAVTFAKLQNIATQRLVGRSTALSGDAEELSVGTGLTITGGALNLTDTTDDDSFATLLGVCANGYSPYKAGGVWTCIEATDLLVNDSLVKRGASGNFAANVATFNGVKLNNAGSEVLITNPIGAAYNLTLPVDDGTPNQVLQTDGSGVLSWVTSLVSGGTGLFANGTAAAPSISFTNDPNTGFFNPSNDSNVIATSTNGVERMRVDATGQVGIGTTAPTSALHVNGNITTSDGTANVPSLTFASDNTTGLSGTTNTIRFITGGVTKFTIGTSALYSNTASSVLLSYSGVTESAPSYSFNGDTDTGIFRPAADNVAISTGGAEKIRIDSSGKVGIGTTAPTAALMLKAGTAAAGTAPLKLTAGVNLTTPEAGAIEFDGTSLFYTDSGNVRRTLGVAGSGITALTGEVTASGTGSVAATIADNAITNAKMADNAVNTAELTDDAVTFAKLQNIATQKLIGRSTAASGDAEELGVGTGLTITGGNLNLTDTTDDDSFATLLGVCADGFVPYRAGGVWTCLEAAAANTNSTLVMREADGDIVATVATLNGVKLNNAGNVTTITTAASGNYSLTLPVDDGTPSQVLQTDGAGVLSWTTITPGTGDFKADGSVDMTGTFKAVAGTAALPGITFVGDTNNGIYAPAADNVAITTNGTEKMRVLSNGNVGIGTTAPDRALHVAKNGVATMILEQPDAGVGLKKRFVSSFDGDLSFGKFADDMTSTTHHMRIDTNGNVGIGTTAPGTKLQVAGTLRVGDGGETCSGGNFTGGIRYNGGNLQFCNGTAWSSLGVAGSGITALTGEVTASGTGSVAATIANDAVTTVKIADDNVTFAKLQNIATQKLIGRSTAASGDAEELGVGTGLTITGGNLNLTDTTDDDSFATLLGVCANGYSPYKAGGVWTCIEATDLLVNDSLVKRGATGNFAANVATFNGVKLNNAGSEVLITNPIGAAYNLTLPVDDGTVDQVLKTDGAGVLSWTTITPGTGDFKADGSVDMTGTFKAVAGTAALPGITFVGDTNNGIYAPAADNVAITTSGAEKMRILANGNVGIGTTAPGSNLEISGAASANPGFRISDADLAHGMTTEVPTTTYFDVIPNDSNGGGAKLRGYSSGSSLSALILDGVIGHTSPTAAAISLRGFKKSGTTKAGLANGETVLSVGNGTSQDFTVLGSGNVGIGTTVPTAALMLKAGTAAAGTAPLKLTAGTNLTTPEAGAIEFDGTSLFYTDSGNVRRTLGVAGSGITALTGEVTASGTGSVAATIANDAVTTVKIADDNVTFAKLQNIATQKLIGRSTAASGDAEELGVGTGLTITGGNLNLTDTTDDDSFATLLGVCANGYSPYKAGGVWTCIEATDLLVNDSLVKRGASGNFAANVATFNGVKLNNAGSEVLITNPIGAAYNLTLPVDDGTPNQVLQTDGSGVLSWVSPAGAISGLTAGRIPYAASATSLVDSASLVFDASANAKMTINGSTSTQINLGSNGNAAPSDTSVGWKLLLRDSGNASTHIGFGVEDGQTMFAVAGSGGSKFYSDNGSAYAVQGQLFDTANNRSYFNTRFGVEEATPDAMVEVSANAGATDLLMLSSDDAADGDRFIVKNSGNVGIGTTAPTAALMLKAGTAAAGTAPLKLTAGTNLTTPEAGAIEYDGTSLYYTDSTNTRRTIVNTSTGGGDFMKNGSVAMTGNLQLGTHYINNDGGSEGLRFDTAGRATIETTNASSSAGLVLQNTATSAGSGSLLLFKHGTVNGPEIESRVIGSTANMDLLFQVRGSSTNFEAMRIKSTGGVGIGTTDPSAVLQLKAGTAAAGTAPLKLTAGTNLTTPESGAIEYDGTNLYYTDATNTRRTIVNTSTGGGDFYKNGSVAMTGDLQLQRNISGGNTGNVIDTGTAATNILNIRTSDADLHLRTINNNNIILTTNSSERLRINTVGNIGIGTTNPAYPLHVKNDSTGLIMVEMQNNTLSNGPAYLGRRSGDSAGSPSATASGSYLATFGGRGYGTTGWASASTASMTMIAEENFTDTSMATGYIIRTTPTASTFATEKVRITGAGNVGIGVTAPAEKLEVNGNILATAFLYSSDRRLKKDIVPLDHSLEKIMSLSTVNFDWKAPLSPEAQSRQIGLIAQEVQKVYPEAVKESADGFLRVNYSALISPVIDAVRSLYKKIVGVDTKVVKLENKVQELEKKNQELEARLQKIEESLNQRKPASKTSK